MQMAGMDAVASCKKYYSRINGMHVRDFAPPKDPSSRGIVPLGEGNINLKALMDFLRQQRFGGFVMGEGIGNESNFSYMSKTLGLEF
jgi:sugar phosphate isomerase/epimerase